MDTIVRSVLGKTIPFDIYTKEEADIKGIDYVPWREANCGDWAISDDDYVGLCYDRKTYTQTKVDGTPGNTSAAVYMCYGVAWISTKRLSYIERRETGTFHTTSPMGWVEREARKGRTKRAVKQMAQYIVANEPVDWDHVGQLYRPDQAVPRATAKRLFKQARIQEMVQHEVEEALQTEEIDRTGVIKLFKDAYDMAIDERQPASMVRVAENFSDMLQMKKPDEPAGMPIGTGGSKVVDGIFDEAEALLEERQKQIGAGE